jgi:outer membrane lipoprotein-sorting protein
MGHHAGEIERIRSSQPQFRTLRIEGREWRHHQRLGEAFMRNRRGGGMMVGISINEQDATEERDEVWRMWIEAPDRRRVEFGVGQEMVTAVFEGGTWWSWSPSQGARTNGGRPDSGHGAGPGEVLVDPTTVLWAVKLELLGEGEFLGRTVYRLRATPISDAEAEADVSKRLRAGQPPYPSFALHELGSGADDYELVVDRERGFLLRAEARLSGQPFRVLEVTAIAVDEPLAADLFVLEPPDGEEFDDSEPMRRATLDELPDAVPFAVFVLAQPAGSIPPTALIHKADRRRGTPIAVRLSYQILKPGGAMAHLSIHESGEPPPAPPAPSVLAHAAEALRAMSAGDETTFAEMWRSEGELSLCEQTLLSESRFQVRLVRDSTHLELESSTVELVELVALARTLVPLAPR